MASLTQSIIFRTGAASARITVSIYGGGVVRGFHGPGRTHNLSVPPAISPKYQTLKKEPNPNKLNSFFLSNETSAAIAYGQEWTLYSMARIMCKLCLKLNLTSLEFSC